MQFHKIKYNKNYYKILSLAITAFSLFSIFSINSCSKDSLGFDPNVEKTRITPIPPDTPKVIPKAKLSFEMTTSYFDELTLIPYPPNQSIKQMLWSKPHLIQFEGIMDTSGIYPKLTFYLKSENTATDSTYIKLTPYPRSDRIPNMELGFTCIINTDDTTQNVFAINTISAPTRSFTMLDRVIKIDSSITIREGDYPGIISITNFNKINRAFQTTFTVDLSRLNSERFYIRKFEAVLQFKY